MFELELRNVAREALPEISTSSNLLAFEASSNLLAFEASSNMLGRDAEGWVLFHVQRDHQKVASLAAFPFRRVARSVPSQREFEL